VRLCVHTINLPDAVMLGRAYNGGGASPVGLQGHVTFVAVCSKLAAAAYAIRAEARDLSIMCPVS